MSIESCLLGTAIGDALGLPYEGVAPGRAIRLLGAPDRYRLIAHRGMISDDTEHACITAQALIASAGEPEKFSAELARRLRWWLLAIPPGVGFATLRGILKTAAGVSPDRSGVFSAGNGAAMRAPVIGAAIDDLDRLRELVHRSTVITHRDPQAEWGALAVAIAARHARSNGAPDPHSFTTLIDDVLPHEAGALRELIFRSVDAAQSGRSVREFAAAIGLERGVTGYVNHTVPVAICAWLRHAGDIRAAVTESIRCGGDTDTVAAIAGGITGAGLSDELPDDLLSGLFEWPRTVLWIKNVAAQLETVTRTGSSEHPVDVPFAGSLVRNLVLLAIVLAHGFRRILPPYG